LAVALLEPLLEDAGPSAKKRATREGSSDFISPRVTAAAK
jgi:hypothetical protein